MIAQAMPGQQVIVNAGNQQITLTEGAQLIRLATGQFQIVQPQPAPVASQNQILLVSKPNRATPVRESCFLKKLNLFFQKSNAVLSSTQATLTTATSTVQATQSTVSSTAPDLVSRNLITLLQNCLRLLITTIKQMQEKKFLQQVKLRINPTLLIHNRLCALKI